MKKITFFIALLFFTSLSFAQDRNLKLVKAPVENPTNQKRKAVVIGMSNYGAGKSLNNTINDANDMTDVLTRLGFEVTLLKNNDLRNLKTNLSNWYNTIEGNDMAVFYFAGHGVEVSGQNYLIPIEAELASQTDVQYNTLNVNQVLGNMDEKRVGMKLLILDACRDNPFTRAWNRGNNEKGLAGMSAPKGTYIAFAASPGATAQDGGTYQLRNGVFTHFLKKEILKAGASIDEIFNNVTGDVSELTHEQQTPFKNSSLTRTFYFIPPGNNDKPDPSPTPAPVVDVAELVSQADTYYNNKQYSEAFPLYKQAAERGDAFSQNRLGFCYMTGWGVTQDYTQAVHWYKKATEQGFANAQNNLGLCYSNGWGVTQDDTQAVYWYKEAAEQGLANAQYGLGFCYYNGRGVTQDHTQAVHWYKKAAEQGFALAQYSLGICYYNGQGVTQDHTQAVHWFKEAAEQGLVDAQIFLGNSYYNGRGVTQDYTQAVYWSKKGAEQGNANAQYNLGNSYYYGRSVTQDYTQAVHWYKKAAEQGFTNAQYNLGVCYERGQGVTKDNTQAVYWYKKAAEQGFVDAQYNLGVCYYNGQGVVRDNTQAVHWFKKAAEQGQADAQKALDRLQSKSKSRK